METNKYENREYPNPKKLESVSGRYFVIPSSLILDTEIDSAKKRLTMYSYSFIRKGMDDVVPISINNIVKWLGREPNRVKGGINERIIQAANYLKEKGYLSFESIPNNHECIYAKFNLDKVTEECQSHNRFALIYIDEFEKIINYKSKDNDNYVNNDTLFLVFVFLRMIIYRRSNKLLPEEVGYVQIDGYKKTIEERRRRNPEAYDNYFKDIAEMIGTTDRTVSKATAILNELGLIYSESLPREKYKLDGKEKWQTKCTIFCNAYKREGDCLLAEGKDYYEIEIKNKKEKLKRLGFKNVGESWY